MDYSQIFEKGIVGGLFVMSFVFFLHKGIPFFVKMIQDVLIKTAAEHTHQVELLTRTFKDTLDVMTRQFLEDVKTHNEEARKNHAENTKRMDSIFRLLEKIEKRETITCIKK